MMRGEGVIKFSAEHASAPLARPEVEPVLEDLLGWRAVLHELGLVGQDPARYEGAGYGNLSARVPPWDAEPGHRGFAVTGTQTGGKPYLTVDDLCVVGFYDYVRNQVRSHGRVLPSSESMTHGAVYDLWAATRFVFHVHAPVLWRNARELGLPTTRPDVEYGTPEMAQEVLRLFRTSALRTLGVFAMGGHEDGIVAFGPSARETGAALLETLAAAYGRRATATVGAASCASPPGLAGRR